MTEVIRNVLKEAHEHLTSLMSNEESLEAITKAGELLAQSFKSGGRAFSCGNGGSMCDAMHFAEELSGRFRDDRPGLPATSISDPSHISCVGNDYGYEEIFSRYIEAHGRKGDVLLAITTSGTSKNVVSAAKKAKELGVQVIGLTGKSGTVLADLSDILICTPGGKYADRIQELHIKVIHTLIELVERNLYPDNYE